jgi:hypothetical protein
MHHGAESQIKHEIRIKGGLNGSLAMFFLNNGTENNLTKCPLLFHHKVTLT